MNEVTITVAPQARLSVRLYAKWMETNTGTEEDFVRFMMTPSTDREDFLSRIRCDVNIERGLGTVNYSV